MNMNDKEYPEFWDNELEDDDDDEYNDLGSDVDANNDETFDNAAEWNEDEHEELIARDSILSHTIRTNHRSSNTRTSNNTSNNNNNNVNSISDNNTINSSINSINNNGNLSYGSPFGRSTIGSVCSRAGWGTLGDKDFFTSPQNQSSSSNNTWQSMPNTTDRIQSVQQPHPLIQNRFQEQHHHQQQQQQQQRQLQQLQQEHLLLERQILQQQRVQQDNIRAPPQLNPAPQVLTVDELERQLLRPRMEQPSVPAPAPAPRVLTVDELERQLLSARLDPGTHPELANSTELPKRTGWSPFGSPFGRSAVGSAGNNNNRAGWGNIGDKDFFTSPPHQNQSPSSSNNTGHHQPLNPTDRVPLNMDFSSTSPQDVILEQQHKQLQHQRQQQQHLIERQILQQQQRMRLDNNQASTQQQQQQNSRTNPRQIFSVTVDEQRRQFSRTQNDQAAQLKPTTNTTKLSRRPGRGRFGGNFIIIPPQVQLNVIDKASRLHPAASRQSDEFLQDKMVPSRQGLLFKKCSPNEKAFHDGVLTEKERNWLTKIQEKIQADYDDKLDQDYYYLLYFNRSSMTDEAANKPCGPGVLDRRFIPRERLLYNTST